MLKLFFKKGWANFDAPNLVTRTLVSKTKDAKTAQTAAVIATRYKDVDIFKGNFRSPFEKNIVNHFGLLENINDFVFTEL